MANESVEEPSMRNYVLVATLALLSVAQAEQPPSPTTTLSSSVQTERNDATLGSNLFSTQSPIPTATQPAPDKTAQSLNDVSGLSKVLVVAIAASLVLRLRKHPVRH